MPLPRAARSLAILFLTFLATTVALAKDVTLGWDVNNEPGVVGYNVYFGQVGSSAQRTPVTTNEALIRNLTPGTTYFFYVTAHNSAGLESLPSEQILHTVPVDTGSANRIGAPTVANAGILIRSVGSPGATYRIEATDDLGSRVWVPLGNVTADTTGAYQVQDPETRRARFYRAVRAD